MALLKLKPALKDYIWGGYRLADEYGKAKSGVKIAETWELSCYPDSPSVIENGEFKGQTLEEYIRNAGKEVLGDNCRSFEFFPLLIKLIDAHDDLSIQVHPDNDYAKRHEKSYGKTEMWYILDAAEDSYICCGFDRELTKQEFARRLEENTFMEVVKKIKVSKGDIIFINPGTLHSIGKGILTAEIQQNSDITYRIYDYGRKDKDGRARQLHIDKALDVTRLAPTGKTSDFAPHIGKCDYFTVDLLKTEDKAYFEVDGTSFKHLLFTDGEGKISAYGESLDFAKGSSFFIGAGSGGVTIEGRAEALVTYEG